MKHTMNLNQSPFDKIKSGVKTIELRLNDEKRRKIQIGDEIEFVNNSETLLCNVVNLHRFNSFAELYNELPLLKCGYTPEDIDTASPDDMNEYYTAKQQKKYGVVGIEIKLI